MDKRKIKSTWRVIDLRSNETSYQELTLNEVGEMRADTEWYSGMVIERPIFAHDGDWKSKLSEDSEFWFMGKA